MRSSEVKEIFHNSAIAIAEAVKNNDAIEKEKIIATGVISGLEYLAKKSTNEIDDTVISIVKTAFPFFRG